jgi:hypothetical protein
VASFADRFEEFVDAGNTRRVAADGLAVAGSIIAFERTHREFFEFSPKAIERLRKFGPIPNGEGFFRGFVRSGPKANSPFAGPLDWKPVSLVPEQALALQTAVATLALRAAIQEVAEAVERVEGKVDKLITLARSERLGSVLGDQLTLQALANRVREEGRISNTDWSTVASLGSLISRDIAALRAYILRVVEHIEKVRFAQQRSAELEELTDDMINESLALLVLAEQNYVLWQELRVANVATHERNLLGQTIDDVHAQLKSLAVDDQKMIDAVQAAARELLDPTGFEGFALLTRRRMNEDGERLNGTVGWFAKQRLLAATPLEIDLPTLSESVENARAVAAVGLDVASSKVKSFWHGLRDNDEPDVPDERNEPRELNGPT